MLAESIDRQFEFKFNKFYFLHNFLRILKGVNVAASVLGNDAVYFWHHSS